MASPRLTADEQDALFHTDQDAWERDVVKEAREYWAELGTLKDRKEAYSTMDYVSVSREREQAQLIIQEMFEEWGVWEEEGEEDDDDEEEEKQA